MLGLLLFVRVVLVCRHHDECFPRLCSFASFDERGETAASYCEVQAGTATAFDTMRWVGMIARRTGVVRQDEFSVPVSYARNVTLGL